jgi:hypothetical protein
VKNVRDILVSTPPRGITTDRAFVVSIHDDGCQGMLCRGTLHINLKWHGKHDISDFDLDQLGEVMQCETETETVRLGGRPTISPS